MMPSHEDRLILTGMLGEVMRESAQAALSYVRSNAASRSTPRSSTDKIVHLHVPAGRLKDGPSAGVTMVTALTSLRAPTALGLLDVAMTGEITLRGKVLPVGGIREKVLAAHRIGIRTVILPRHNEADLDDVPAELRQEITFRLADDVDQVLEEALGAPDAGRSRLMATDPDPTSRPAAPAGPRSTSSARTAAPGTPSARTPGGHRIAAPAASPCRGWSMRRTPRSRSRHARPRPSSSTCGRRGAARAGSSRRSSRNLPASTRAGSRSSRSTSMQSRAQSAVRDNEHPHDGGDQGRRELDRIVGAMPKPALEARVTPFLGKPSPTGSA